MLQDMIILLWVRESSIVQKTIIIADDHPFTAQGMRQNIEAGNVFKFVGEASNGIAAIALIKKIQPDCALLDLSMPGANGLEVFLEAKRWSPKTRFAIITGLSAATVFRQLYDAGIDGLFVKNSDAAIIHEGLMKMMQGHRIISKEAQKAIDSSNHEINLSKRELEVLQALAKGQTNREIAETLGVSPKTIDTHRTNLLRKMEVKSTAALLVKAMRDSLIIV